METYTISEAAAKWIGMIEAAPKATTEQKAELIAKVRVAAPATIGKTFGVGNGQITDSDRFCFTDATNAIKATMRS